jgi:dipeptidyl aminopeptidase/acylaminoacyl peptidase
MRLLLQCAALCCALLVTGAQARPFTASDLLQIDQRGAVGLSPDGRWLILTVTRGQAFAPRYDYDAVYPFASRRLYRVDLLHPGPAQPLMEQESGAGYTASAFSPDGRRLLVNRLRGHQWETGVVDVVTGKVRWLGVGMDFALFGRAAQWRNNTEIVAVVTSPDNPHVLLRRGWQRAQFTAQARTRTATSGEASVLSIGSGRFLDRGAKGPQKDLVRINVETGESHRLATGDFTDLEVSRSGNYVAAFVSGPDIQPKAGETIKGGTIARRRDLLVADLRSDMIIAGCEWCFASPFLLAWSEDDRLLVHLRRVGELPETGKLTIIAPSPGGLDLKALDAVKASLASTREGYEYPQAGWVGPYPAVLGRRADAVSSEAATWLLYDDHGVRSLLPEGSPLPDRIVAERAGGFLAVGGGRAVRSRGGRIARLDEATLAPTSSLGDTGRPTMSKLRSGEALMVIRNDRLVRLTDRMELDLGPVGGQALVTGDNGAVVHAERDPHGVETVKLAYRGETTSVLSLNPQLKDVEFGDLRPIKHLGPRGEALTSWLLLPPDWRQGQLPPLVVLPYPGRVFGATAPPESARAGSGLSDVSPHVLSSHGYAVLYPSLPRNRFPDDPAQGLADEILNVVDAVGAAGLADTRRLVMWGHSFGGHGVLSAASQSDRFRAIVCTSGIADLASAWGSFVIQTTPDEGLFFLPTQGYIETGQMRVGGPPWAAPERYVANSPLFSADKVSAPILLAYGDLDQYSDGQGGEMFAALYRQGKDARLLTFFGEGHVINAPANVVRLYDEALGWFDSALQRIDRPNPAQSPSPGASP